MGTPLSTSSAGHHFDDIDKLVGLTVSPHSLRHYFGSSLVSEGVSVVAVSRWLGHSSPKITWRVYFYLMANDENAGRAAKAATLARAVPEVDPLGTERAAQ